MIFNVTKNLKKYLWTNQKSYTNWITKIDQKYRLDYFVKALSDNTINC